MPVAADVIVTSAADAGAGSLREALLMVGTGGTIGFAPALAGATLRLGTTLPITRTTIINAGAAPAFTIVGGRAVRVFEVSAGVEATFIGLTVAQGRAVGSGTSPGGAINTGNDAKLTIRSCTFRGNVADIGGAIRAGYDTETIVEDCSFYDNNGDGGGANNGFSAGAIATNGHGLLTIRRSRFERNHGHSGGAVYNLLQPLLIEDCWFNGNTSSGPGAAVFTDEGNWVGPGATVGGTITVRRCWIENNRGHEVGGALFLWANPLDVVTVEDCVLRNNRVDRGGDWNDAKGGGLRTRGILTINRCAFVGNISAGQGGGAWLDGDGPFLIENTTFSGNRVTDDAGGALNLNISGPLVMRHCTLVGNFAQRACGAFWLPSETAPVTLYSCIVAANSAGTDHGQDQIGYAPHDGGGNVEFPAPVGGGRRVASGGLLADPMLSSIERDDRMFVAPLLPGSPAIGRGIATGAPATDARGAPRDVPPDAGAFEAAPGGGG